MFARLPEADYHANDLRWHTSPELGKEKTAISEAIEARIKGIATADDLRIRFGNDLRCMPSSELFFEDPHDDFFLQKIAGTAEHLVESPAALMYDNAELTTVLPSKDGTSVQLVYDLGEQACGYYEIDLLAPEGAIVDICGVEYIRADGVIQHTEGNRNGIRYKTVAGRNRFVSIVRRSQRYLFVTLRAMSEPVRIRKIGLIESTYPVHYRANFHCSDTRLDKIWEISERTLKLCMEDTFTDCPLYEQTLWVGDQRAGNVPLPPGEVAVVFAGHGLAVLPSDKCVNVNAWTVEGDMQTIACASLRSQSVRLVNLKQADLTVAINGRRLTLAPGAARTMELARRVDPARREFYARDFLEEPAMEWKGGGLPY